MCLASQEEEEVTILGIDDYGYLRVRTNKMQELLSLQPDGNTFDIMKGLIAIWPIILLPSYAVTK